MAGNNALLFDTDVAFASLSAATGLAPTMLLFLVCFFASVPITMLMAYVPGTRTRQLYSFLTGFVLLYTAFGEGVKHIYMPAMLSYAFMALAPTHCGLLTWATVFPYLISVHALNASGDTWKEGGMDFTGAAMVATLKVISCAVNYQDGRSIKEAQMTPSQKRLHITKLPDPLEYASYLVGCGSLLVGPTFEVRDWLAFCSKQDVWKDKSVTSKARIPGALCFGQSLVWLVLHLYLDTLCPLTTVDKPFYASLNYPSKIAVMVACCFVSRCKYYFSWKLSESALIFCGFGYAGEGKWDRISNCHPISVELCTSGAKFPDHWNIQTSLWLRYYVYERLVKPGTKPGFWQVLMTQLVSAIWHGLYPGYLFFFSSSSLFFEAAKVLFRWEKAYRTRSPAVANAIVALNTVLTVVNLNYSALPFLLVDWAPGIHVWSSVSYIPHMEMLAICILGAVVKPPKAPSAKKSA